VTSFPGPTQLGTARKVSAVSTPIIVDSGPPPGPWQPDMSRRVTFPEGEQSNQFEFGHDRFALKSGQRAASLAHPAVRQTLWSASYCACSSCA
jgi:hypothetical protein